MEMETSVSATGSLSLSLHSHSFPPNTNTTTNHNNTLQVFNLKPPTQQQPLLLSTQPPNLSKPFPQQKPAFKNPRSVYNDTGKLARHDKLREALTLVDHMDQKAHALLIKNGFLAYSSVIKARLIDMYFKCGEIELARQVFEESSKRDVVVWGAMIAGFSRNGLRRQALEYVRLMVEDGIRPDVVTVAIVVPICAQLRALKQGKEIHAYALKRWFLPHVSIVSSLMVLYSKCGAIKYSMKLFDGMERRNVILWTAMIDSYVENGCMYEALGVIRSMKLTEHRPDSVTVARMLSVCGELKLVKLGKEIHGQVLKRDFESVHYVSAELINMYGTCGVVDKAKLVFSAVPVKGSMAWTALIRAYGYKEWHQDAIDLFDHMISNGCSPNHFTFEAVLSICDRAGFVEDAFRIFNLMSGYKIEASEEHCTIMIRLLTRYGKLDEAQRFLEMCSSL